MEYPESVIRSHLSDFARANGLGGFLNTQEIEAAGRIAATALAQWPNQMAQTLPQLTVDWRQFSLSVAKLTLYDVHIFIDQDPTMRSSPVRWRHVQQQVEKTVEIILPFLARNNIQMHFCDKGNPAGVVIKSVNDVTNAFGTSEFGSFGPNTLPLGLTLKEKVVPLLPNTATVQQRPKLVYVFTTGMRGDGRQFDLVQYVNEIKGTIKARDIVSPAMAFEIVQIGRNYPARQELGRIDTAYGSGEFLDVSSETRIEERYRQEKAWSPINPAVLAIRNLVGALEPWLIDSRTRCDDLSRYLAEKRASDLQREIGDLKKKLADESTNDRALEDLKRQVDSLKRQVAEKDSKISAVQSELQQSLANSRREADQLRRSNSTLSGSNSSLTKEKQDLHRRLTTTHRYLMQWKSNNNNAVDIANGIGPLRREHLFYGGVNINGQFKNSHGYGNYDHLISGRQRVEEPLVS